MQCGGNQHREHPNAECRGCDNTHVSKCESCMHPTWDIEYVDTSHMSKAKFPKPVAWLHTVKLHMVIALSAKEGSCSIQVIHLTYLLIEVRRHVGECCREGDDLRVPSSVQHHGTSQTTQVAFPRLNNLTKTDDNTRVAM